MWANGQQIEVRGRLIYGTSIHLEADFIFDMTTFKILKNRWGVCDMTPLEGYCLLAQILDDKHARILLLTD